jgi:hypothetical protein
MASRRGPSAGARWVALRFVRGESVARFGARSEFSGRRGAQAARSENFFWGRRIVRPRRLQVIARSLRIGAQRFWHTRCEPVRMPETLVPQGFSWVGEISACVLHASAGSVVARGERGDGPHGDGGGGFRRPQFVKRSRCFSHCAVVIGVQCMSIRDCTVPKSPSLMARRAVWRREPNRRRNPRRRRLRRRPSAKPRAGRSSLRRVHAIGLQVASRGVASVGGLPCQHAQRCCGTRRQSRRRRASATAGALGSRRGRFSYRQSIKPDLPLGRCAMTAPLAAFVLDRS